MELSLSNVWLPLRGVDTGIEQLYFPSSEPDGVVTSLPNPNVADVDSPRSTVLHSSFHHDQTKPTALGLFTPGLLQQCALCVGMAGLVRGSCGGRAGGAGRWRWRRRLSCPQYPGKSRPSVDGGGPKRSALLVLGLGGRVEASVGMSLSLQGEWLLSFAGLSCSLTLVRDAWPLEFLVHQGSWHLLLSLHSTGSPRPLFCLAHGTASVPFFPHILGRSAASLFHNDRIHSQRGPKPGHVRNTVFSTESSSETDAGRKTKQKASKSSQGITDMTSAMRRVPVILFVPSGG